MEKRNQAAKLIIGGIIVALAILFLAGIIGGKDILYHLKDRSSIGPLTRSDIRYQEVAAPKATSRDGTINAADWAAAYPYIVTTMGDNDKNSYAIDYLEQDPYLTTIYEGFGFAKDYASARGHAYTLEDVGKTLRPHAKRRMSQNWSMTRVSGFTRCRSTRSWHRWKKWSAAIPAMEMKQEIKERSRLRIPM